MDRTNKMLIDASHPEETRVVVLKNGRVEEFDFESASRKLLRGNVYLAKITRVEPSLQAAFVEYGGNRHGFLAFSEIHPDYYQIPVADREALKQEEAREEAREEAEAEERAQRRGRRGRERGDRDRGRNNGNGDLHADDRNGDQRRSDDAHGAPDGDAAHPGDYPRDPIEAGASGESHPAREVPLGHTPDDRLTEHAEPARNYDREHRVASHITDAPEPIGNVEDQGVVEINGNDDASGADAEGVEEVATTIPPSSPSSNTN